MGQEKPKPVTPSPSIELPGITDTTASVLTHGLMTGSASATASGVIDDSLQHLIVQGIAYLLPAGQAAAHYRAGQQCFDKRQFTDAIVHFSAAIEHDSKNIFPWFQRARTYASLGKPEQAILDYTAVLEREPNYSYAYQNRALSHWKLGDIVAADANLDRAYALATTLDHQMFVSAIKHEVHQDYQAAVDGYTYYLKTHPDNTYSLARRAICYRALKQDDLAFADYTTLLEFDPNSLYSLRLRGRLLVYTKRFVEAIEDYRRAIALEPDNAISHFWLARACEGIEQWDVAIVSYLRCLELDPQTLAALWSLGKIYATCGRPADAIAAYTAYIDQHSDPSWQARAQQQIDQIQRVET